MRQFTKSKTLRWKAITGPNIGVEYILVVNGTEQYFFFRNGCKNRINTPYIGESLKTFYELKGSEMWDIGPTSTIHKCNCTKEQVLYKGCICGGI